MEKNLARTAEGLSAFLEESPTPYHAVETCRKQLCAGGFSQLHEGDAWSPLAEQKGFFCQRGSSLVAWVCGSQAPWESGLRLAGAHTDSPTFKLKLESAHFEHGVLAAHISVYGSPIFATYFDRNLGVAGIAVQPDGQMRLIHRKTPTAIIPNLAIHLNRDANNKLSYNAQNQIQAIFGQKDVSLQRELGLDDDEVSELQLCSTQSSERLGLNRELLSGSRLDDLSMVYLLLQAIGESKQKKLEHWPVVVFCNGEEIGSRTYDGAASNFVQSVLQRIVETQQHSSEAWARTQASSFLLSLDGAHASHPAYPEAFDPNYSLKMGCGPAIKQPNGAASYSSDPYSIAKIRALAKSVGCPLQMAVPRSDKATGSTIGPILSSQLGVRGVDIGLPMYAMHSIQETISLTDYLHLTELVSAYLHPE